MEPLDAAVKVLEEEGVPLHWTKIQDLALRRGYVDPFTQKDLRRRFVAALAAAARDPAGPVEKTGTGVYALRSP
ncbi:MAG TPA: HTH domain-containing protein [Actinomycetota bacterium]